MHTNCMWAGPWFRSLGQVCRGQVAGLLAGLVTGLLTACGGWSADDAPRPVVTLASTAEPAEGDTVTVAAEVDGVPAGAALAYDWKVFGPQGSRVPLDELQGIGVRFAAASAGTYAVEVEVVATLQAAVMSSGPVRTTITVLEADRPSAGDVLLRLRRAAAAGGALMAPDGSSPTIEPGRAGGASSIEGGRLVPWQHPAFSYTGDVRHAGAVYPDVLLGANLAVGYGGSARGSNALAIDFETDAPVFELLTKGTGSSGSFRVVVDGRLASSTPTAYPSDGGLYLTRVSFASSARRHVRVLGVAPRFGGVRLAPPYRVYARASTGPRLRVMFVGDSITEGPAGQAAPSSFAPLAADLLGLQDAWVSGVGETGYLAAIAPRVPLGRRLDADVLAYRPHVVVVALGINDRSRVPSVVAAEASRVFDRIAQQLPETLVYVSGPVGSADTVPAALNDALRGAVAGRRNFTWVPLIDERWLTGTGHAGRPDGTGNADQYLSADGVHPTPEGIRYLADRWSEWLKAAWMR